MWPLQKLSRRTQAFMHEYQRCWVNRPGAFANYLSIPVTNVWHCDPTIPLDVLSCFDPFGNAVHTALSFDVLGEDVLITGAGPIGIMAAAVAKHAGARHVVVTDINDYRLDLARKMGATRAINIRKQIWKTLCANLE
jgi:threonine 3-dehydrogenase